MLPTTILFFQGDSLSLNSLDDMINSDLIFKLGLESSVDINFSFELTLIALLDFFYQELSILIYLGLDQISLKVIIDLAYLLFCLSFSIYRFFIVFWICHVGSVLCRIR